MKKNITATLALTLSSAALITGAFAGAQTAATQAKPLMEIFRIDTVTVDGKKSEKRSAVTSVRPGDLIERVVTVTIAKKTTNAAITIPVPRELNYVPGSQALTALGKNVELGGVMKVVYALSEKGPFSAKPTKVVTVTRDGKQVTETVVAPANEYRAVRFELGTIEPGTYVMKHRVTVR